MATITEVVNRANLVNLENLQIFRKSHSFIWLIFSSNCIFSSCVSRYTPEYIELAFLIVGQKPSEIWCFFSSSPLAALADLELCSLESEASKVEIFDNYFPLDFIIRNILVTKIEHDRCYHDLIIIKTLIKMI